MRIGKKMRLAASFVAVNPGCVMRACAHAVSPLSDPTRNEAFGYDIVHRAVRAGLIRAEKQPNRTYRLYPTEKGAAL